MKLSAPALCFVSLLCFSGCNDEPTARFELEKQGFSVIVLTPTEKRGVWDFRANKSDKLEVCSGTVTVKRELGKTSTSSTSTCQPDEEACNPKHGAHCLALGERYRSDDRAKAVVDYLVKKKIDTDRLTWKGYGETKPLKPNTSEENRALNRRVEFRVVER